MRSLGGGAGQEKRQVRSGVGVLDTVHLDCLICIGWGDLQGSSLNRFAMS